MEACLRTCLTCTPGLCTNKRPRQNPSRTLDCYREVEEFKRAFATAEKVCVWKASKYWRLIYLERDGCLEVIIYVEKEDESERNPGLWHHHGSNKHEP